MLSQILNSYKDKLETSLSNTSAEVFLRDISQYKYISQSPCAVLNLREIFYEKPPHASLGGQKATMELSFFYFFRTQANSNTEGVSEFLEAVRGLDDLTVLSLGAYSHRKNTSVWEVKARVIKVM